MRVENGVGLNVGGCLSTFVVIFSINLPALVEAIVSEFIDESAMVEVA